MSNTLDFDASTGCLAPKGELAIYNAAVATETLRQAFESGKLRVLDLSGVTDFDTAGLQWLLMASKLANDKHGRVEVRGLSETVSQVLTLAGLNVQPDSAEEVIS